MKEMSLHLHNHLMYKKIRSHPSPVKVYGEKLINEESISKNFLNESIKNLKIY